MISFKKVIELDNHLKCFLNSSPMQEFPGELTRPSPCKEAEKPDCMKETSHGIT